MRCMNRSSISQGIVLMLSSGLFLCCFQGGVAAKIVFGEHGIYVMNDNGGARRQLTDKKDGWARWSPDGTRIAFARRDANDGQISDVFVIHADGTNLQQLTHYGGHTGMPCWSPDGQKIVFRSDHIGNLELYVIELATKNVTQLTGIQEKHDATAPDWSPDGQRIVYERFVKKQGLHHKNIWVMNTDGTKQEPLFPDPKPDDPTQFRTAPKWSPDGRKILLTESTMEPQWKHRIVIKTIGGGTNVLDLKEKIGGEFVPSQPVWMDGGQAILFGAELFADLNKNPDIYHYNIYRYDLETGQLRKLTRHTSEDNSEPHWVSGALSVSSVGKKKVSWGTLKQ